MRPVFAIALVSVLTFSRAADAQMISQGIQNGALKPSYHPVTAISPNNAAYFPQAGGPAAPLEVSSPMLPQPSAPRQAPVYSVGQPMIPQGMLRAGSFPQPIQVVSNEQLAAPQQVMSPGQMFPVEGMMMAQAQDGQVVPAPNVNQPPAPTFDSQQYPAQLQAPYQVPSNALPYDPFAGGMDMGIGGGCDVCGEPNMGMMGAPCNACFGGGMGPVVPGGTLFPHFYASTYASNNRVVENIGLFLPFYQECDGSLVFADIRGQFDDHEAGEANLGLGYRMFIDPYWVFGNYAYWDILSTSQDNVFHQGTVGFELLSLDWELRANIIFPGTTSGDSQDASGISNRTVITRNFVERPYSGFDAEIGRRFLYWGYNQRFEMRWYMGGYYYENSAAGFPDFGGPRGRLEFRIFDLGWLGPQSRIVMGVEGAYDRVRDGQVAGFARVQIPLGWKSQRPVLDPFRRKLTEAPMRDVD